MLSDGGTHRRQKASTEDATERVNAASASVRETIAEVRGRRRQAAELGGKEEESWNVSLTCRRTMVQPFGRTAKRRAARKRLAIRGMRSAYPATNPHQARRSSRGSCSSCTPRPLPPGAASREIAPWYKVRRGSGRRTVIRGGREPASPGRYGGREGQSRFHISATHPYAQIGNHAASQRTSSGAAVPETPCRASEPR